MNNRVNFPRTEDELSGWKASWVPSTLNEKGPKTDTTADHEILEPLERKWRPCSLLERKTNPTREAKDLESHQISYGDFEACPVLSHGSWAGHRGCLHEENIAEATLWGFPGWVRKVKQLCSFSWDTHFSHRAKGPATLRLPQGEPTWRDQRGGEGGRGKERERERDEDTPTPSGPALEVTLFTSAPFRCRGFLCPGRRNEFVISTQSLP